jgi:hypothetical protein
MIAGWGKVVNIKVFPGRKTFKRGDSGGVFKNPGRKRSKKGTLHQFCAFDKFPAKVAISLHFLAVKRKKLAFFAMTR